jgi:NAD(P)-dependent dehydrogenase (short-subunit alcohol dehydrogenase family)
MLAGAVRGVPQEGLALNPFALDGRTAIVTGAGRGIGAAIAQALDAAGARVALVARSEPELDAVAQGLTNDPVVIAADLGTPDGPDEAAARALDAFGGRLDVLVNNAGAVLRKDTEELTTEELDRLWEVNVRSVLLLCRAVLGPMVNGGGGSIINVSSISAVRGTPRRAAYAATKAALDGMTRSLAMEYGPRRIRVNSVAPGAIETDMWRTPLAQPGVRQQLEGHVALRRLGLAADIAPVVLFLASDASQYMTGETLSVDGGMHATMNLHPPV